MDLTWIKRNVSPSPAEITREQSTQTDDTPPCIKYSNAIQINKNHNIHVKQEPQPLSPIKEENYYDDYLDTFSDNSDNISLITLKNKKRNKKSEINGEVKKRKKKPKLSNLDNLINSLPDSTNLPVTESNNVQASVKQEVTDVMMQTDGVFRVSVDVKQVKKELGELETFNCCICMMQCFSKHEMIQHYR